MSGIVLLILTIISSSCVALVMKAANSLRISLGQLLAVNYLVCSLFLAAWGGWRASGFNSPLIWLLGAFTGFMFVLTLWLFDKAITAGGLAISATLMRLSAAIPTLGSLILFGEKTSGYQVSGIMLAFICLPLAGKEPWRSGKPAKEMWRGMTWGLLLFAAYGMTDFAFKVKAELEPLADPKAFMVVIFGTALLLTLPRLLTYGPSSRACLVWGSLLGAANISSTYFLIRTLAHLPGSVAYPTMGLGVIAVTSLAGLAIWHETLRPANYAFLTLACLAVLLINLG